MTRFSVVESVRHLTRYPHYHAPTETPDKVDYDRLASVFSGLAGMPAGVLAKP